MGQEEEAATPVATARLSRREQARLCRVAQPSKARGDFGKAQGHVPLDIFAEDPLRLDLSDDPRNVRPEVAGIRCPSPFAGLAEGLAWIAGRDEMNAAAPRAAVEGSKVVPDKRLSQGLVFHPGHESGRRMAFPLDESHSSVAGLGDVETEVETSVSGAEGDSPEVTWLRAEGGRYVHKAGSSQPLDRRSWEGSMASWN